jgi:hypothetical protein
MSPLKILLCAILGVVACSFEKDRLSQKEYNAIVNENRGIKIRNRKGA